MKKSMVKKIVKSRIDATWLQSQHSNPHPSTFLQFSDLITLQMYRAYCDQDHNDPVLLRYTVPSCLFSPMSTACMCLHSFVCL